MSSDTSAADGTVLGEALAAAEEELGRRAERIETLRSQVDELRDRLRAQSSEHRRELAARDKRIVGLQRRVRELETSTSYRFGHAVVRVLQEPTLLVRLPGKVAAMVVARLRRWRGR